MYDISSSHFIMLEAFSKSIKDGKKDQWMAYCCWWFYRQQVMNEPVYWSQMGSYLMNQLPGPNREAIADQLNGAERKILQETVEEPVMPVDLATHLQLMFEPTPPTFDLEAAQAAAVIAVDRAAEAYRMHFITPGYGQTMTYQQKLAEARELLANPSIDDDEVPHIIVEAAASGVDPQEKAAEIVSTFEQWRHISSTVEGKRMTAKSAIAAAENEADITAAVNVMWSA